MPATVTQTKPEGRGCLFYGCLTLVALVIVVLLTGYLTIRYVVNTAIENYTDDAPQTFEAVVISDAERKDLSNRIAEFDAAKGKTNEPIELTLTGPDINALIAEKAKDADIGDNVRIDIEGDELKAQATIPLTQFSSMPFLSRLKDRHLNMSFTVGVSLVNGIANLKIISGEVNGTPVPAEILEALKKDQNFQKAFQDPDVQKHFDKLDWNRIEDGEVRIATGGSKPPSE